jgi:GNAT superfamily N-acetyltransferase
VSILVRTATPADAAAITTVHIRTGRLAFTQFLGADYVNAWDAVEQTRRWREEIIVNPELTTLVAHEAEQILGLVLLGPNRDELAGNLGEVYILSVDADNWGRGIGTALLQEADSRLAAAGADGAVLWTFSGYDRTRRFYEHRGWAVDGATKVHSTGAESVRYWKDLKVRPA